VSPAEGACGARREQRWNRHWSVWLTVCVCSTRHQFTSARVVGGVDNESAGVVSEARVPSCVKVAFQMELSFVLGTDGQIIQN
jgi:hypothetical protein